jgi:hypothetical protein
VFQLVTLLHNLEIADLIRGLKTNLPESYIVWYIKSAPYRNSKIIFKILLFAMRLATDWTVELSEFESW